LWWTLVVITAVQVVVVARDGGVFGRVS